MGKDLYFVAVKVFLTDKSGRFLIIHDRFGEWDLPGGRLRPQDFKASLPAVVGRKMREEPGPVRYRLGEPAVFMRHERREPDGRGKKVRRRIFAIGYKAEYLGGKLGLGKNHDKFLWVARRGFRAQKYFTAGWLKGVKEYLRRV